MNLDLAYKTLLLENEPVDLDMIKRQYRRRALLYHPDKNKSPDSSMRFQEVQEAYEVLMKYHGYMDCEDDEYIIEDELNENLFTSYQGMLFSFLQTMIDSDTIQHRLFCFILGRITQLCEAKAVVWLRRIDHKVLKHIYDIIRLHQDIFHLSDEFLFQISEILVNQESTSENNSRIVLHPMLDDLFDDCLYKLHEKGKLFLVPLWHHELVYDAHDSSGDLYVNCIPMLPENVTIDEDNNIEVSLEFALHEIWNMEEIAFFLGKRRFAFPRSCLKMENQQILVLFGKGIAQIMPDDMYDVSCRSNIQISIRIYECK